MFFSGSLFFWEMGVREASTGPVDPREAFACGECQVGRSRLRCDPLARQPRTQRCPSSFFSAPRLQILSTGKRKVASAEEAASSSRTDLSVGTASGEAVSAR